MLSLDALLSNHSIPLHSHVQQSHERVLLPCAVHAIGPSVGMALQFYLQAPCHSA